MLEEILLFLFVLLFTTQSIPNKEALTAYQRRQDEYRIQKSRKTRLTHLDVASTEEEVLLGPKKNGDTEQQAKGGTEDNANASAGLTAPILAIPPPPRRIQCDPPPHLVYPRPSNAGDTPRAADRLFLKPHQIARRLPRKALVRCSRCHKDFKSDVDRQQHEAAVHAIPAWNENASWEKSALTLPPAVCEICQVDFKLFRLLRQHEGHAHPWLVMCRDCPRLFQDAKEAQNHYASVHHTTNFEPRRAQVILDTIQASSSTCGSPTRSTHLIEPIHDLQRHFQCEQCPAVFSDQTELAKHEAYPLAHGKSAEEVFPSLAEATLLLLSKSRSKSQSPPRSASPISPSAQIYDDPEMVEAIAQEAIERSSPESSEQPITDDEGGKYRIMPFMTGSNSIPLGYRPPDRVYHQPNNRYTNFTASYNETTRPPPPPPPTQRQYIDSLIAIREQNQRQQQMRRAVFQGQSFREAPGSIDRKGKGRAIPPSALQPIFDGGWTDVGVSTSMPARSPRKSWKERDDGVRWVGVRDEVAWGESAQETPEEDYGGW